MIVNHLKGRLDITYRMRPTPRVGVALYRRRYRAATTAELPRQV